MDTDITCILSILFQDILFLYTLQDSLKECSEVSTQNKTLLVKSSSQRTKPSKRTNNSQKLKEILIEQVEKISSPSSGKGC